MSREEPTLVVSPITSRRFVGGAAIVAGHAASVGHASTLFSVAGVDASANFLREALTDYGVRHTILGDESRPTTTKIRYRASGKSLLRVSHLRQEAISLQLEEVLLEALANELPNQDLLIFSDFNYGVLTQNLVDQLSTLGRRIGLTMTADCQTSSQTGDISRFKGMDLLTPTEYEARLAVRNFEDGLVTLADELLDRAEAKALLVTLSEDGLLIQGARDSESTRTDRIPALNLHPIDVAGAGDSLLVVSSMALAVGASLPEAALLGSVAGALQVAVTGNLPVTLEALVEAVAQ